VPEVRRLLVVMRIVDLAERERLLRWSAWRRAHQASARDAHMRRRARRINFVAAEPRIVSLPTTVALSDEGWDAIVPLLPHKSATGRPAHDHRQILQGILWVARTGAPWREVPTAFGPWETIHSRYSRWRKEGIWSQIITALHPTTRSPELA
jgi:hypothetical protein